MIKDKVLSEKTFQRMILDKGNTKSHPRKNIQGRRYFDYRQVKGSYDFKHPKDRMNDVLTSTSYEQNPLHSKVKDLERKVQILMEQNAFHYETSQKRKTNILLSRSKGRSESKNETSFCLKW